MRTETKLWVLVGILLAITGALGVYAGVQFLDEREQKKVAQDAGEVVATEGDDLAARVQAACREGGEAAKALADTNACAQADKTRETIKDAPVEPSATATPAPPQATRYVPVPGARGPGPTLAQIGRAVARVIDNVVADQIDQAVAEQLDAALQRACGGSCKGDKGDSIKGDKGDSVTGPAGADAPRITNIACDGTTGVFRFSDDSVIRVDGMCDEPGLLEPAPEPTE